MTDKAASSSFIFREARASDIPALAQLHARAWRETYEQLNPPANFVWPTAELRAYQWREIFNRMDGSWFCWVIENSSSELIGFAKGKKYDHSELPDFSGELNKIYLLRAYHKQGLGKKLIGHVVDTFIKQGIFSMVLFSEPMNPTGKFFEALGAEKIYAENGEFHGGYGWRDLKTLAAICSIS